MYFGSVFHLGSVVLVLAVTVALWQLLRRTNVKIQSITILCLMAVNVLQHFLKFLLYPQYRGMGFTLYCTAYNVCACLIIASPFVFLWGNRFFKNTLYFIGLAAGIGAVAFPYWFFGTPVRELGWQYFRFYLCHGLLFISSMLPLLLGFHQPRHQDFWQVGLGFLLILCVVLLNNVIFMTLGLYPEGAGQALYEQLVGVNPCMMMGPKENMAWFNRILERFSPSVFLGHNASGLYAPILWYAIPVYLGISLAAFVVFALLDWRNFRYNWKKH